MEVVSIFHLLALSRKIWSAENFGPGPKFSDKIGPTGPKLSGKKGCVQKKRSGYLSNATWLTFILQVMVEMENDVSDCDECDDLVEEAYGLYEERLRN